MSNATYTQLLNETSDLVVETTNVDSNLQTDPQVDIKEIRSTTIELYYRYILISNKLNICYDQIVQPQKRILVRKLLDNCLGRVIELRNELVEIDLNEYSYDDAAMLRLNMSPIDAELTIPRYFLRENNDIEKRREFIEETLTKLGYVSEEKFKIPITEQEAILIIQSHERARQGRLRGRFMKEIRNLKDSRSDHTKVKDEVLNKSAILIQKLWRGFKVRKEVKIRRYKEMVLIGMLPKEKSNRKEIFNKMREVEEYRYELQRKHETNYKNLLESIEKRFREEYSEKLTNEISGQLRNYFESFYNRTGKFPEFPNEDQGGSRTMFSRIASESELSAPKSTSNISSKDSFKKSKDKKSNKSSSEAKNKEDDSELPGQTRIAPSIFLSEIINTAEEYEDTWKFKDESDNPNQKPYEDIIEREKMIKIEQEIRSAVDNMMRAELELLQAALDKDRAHRKKPKKQQKKVKRSSKKGKKKREKDLTPDRTTESLFEELITNGIIKPYPLVKIDDFVGEPSFAADEILAQGRDIEPCLGDIRKLIKEICIIPLGSEYVHRIAPICKSVLITGPQGSGKKMLLHAICSEVGAVLFDLTPSNIVGKYPGKTGLIMLIHLVNKVSRLLQPSIIWMDTAEKPFVKKTSKSDKTDPKRLKKDLFKMVKAISPEDRVLFVGTSTCPWEADIKLLLQTYHKVIQIPRPDYNTMSHFWRSYIDKLNGLKPDFDISTIARISDGYTIGKVLESLKCTLTSKRRLQLCIRGLSYIEIITSLSKQAIVYIEEDDYSYSWSTKQPLAKRKQMHRRRDAELANL